MIETKVWHRQSRFTVQARAYFGLFASLAATAAAESSPRTSSTAPYFTACWASRKRSRSLSSRMRSVLWPVHLAMMAMSVFPWAFPQITRMLTGTGPSDKAFRDRYTEVLREVTRRMKPASAPRPAHAAHRAALS